MLTVKACHLLIKRCQGFLCSVLDAKDTKVKLEDIPVVREFPNVFLEDFPSVLIEREIGVGIDVMPKTQQSS